jgi:hypothetical protein
MIIDETIRSLLSFLVLLAVVSIALGEPPSKEWQARTRLAKEMDIAESAPDWLVNSESYAGGCDPNDWNALAQSKVAFITHCPVNRELFQRCHALSIRCFPYVTFYQGFATVTHQGLNLKDHPEFIEVDAQGNLKRTGFWESEDAKNMYTTCPNTKEYQDAMVAWVRKIMEAGADGVFIDNLSSRAPCFGEKSRQAQAHLRRSEPRLRHAAQASARGGQAIPARRRFVGQFRQSAVAAQGVLEISGF